MIVLGIDNGLDGAVVALDDNGRVEGWFDTPTVEIKRTRRQIAPRSMANAIRCMLPNDGRHAMAFVESGQPIGTDGVISNWHNGASYAGWRCLLAALGIPWEEVKPQAWQRAMLRGVPGDDTKKKSLHRAQGLFPDLPLMSSSRAKSLNMHGRSDAALIAEYGRRRLAGKE